MPRLSTTLILQGLRQQLHSHGLGAYIIPSGDAHNSEYLSERDKRRAFVSGFDGSAGVAIVTRDKALLWTDGRYHLQAENQIDDNWTLMKEGVTDTPTRQDWLAKNIPTGGVVGADPFLITNNEWIRLKQRLEDASVIMKPITPNLVDLVWGGEQPSYPENEVLPLEMKFTGMKWEDKVEKCRQKMKERKVGCLVLSALDDVAWLLNLRGSDISFNPVFFAYVTITMDKVNLFISEAQVTPLVKQHLRVGSSDVQIRSYEDIKGFLEDWSKSNEKSRVWMSNNASQGLVSKVGQRQKLLDTSPVALMKAIKNETEIKGFINCHIKDAAALCSYFAWLEKKAGSGEVDEISGATELERLRSEMEHYVGLSFDTISAVGPNGAHIHYRSKPDTCRPITTEELYLVDSGAQYKDGTTDVTRTLHFGRPSQYEKECFTRVLKGHLNLARAVFPKKIFGNSLDTLARTSLWDVGLNYLHGTGHGVGAYLNVHEGPMGISSRPHPEDPGLQENMVLSNEPGYYEDGKFGIRLENLVRIVKADTKYTFKNQQFLTFDNLTLVPIQRKMIDPSLLTKDEEDYLNEYHEICREKVGSLLREMGKKEGLNWLVKETEPIG